MTSSDPGVSVEASGATAALFEPSTGLQRYTAPVDARGSYIFPTVSPGTYSVFIAGGADLLSEWYDNAPSSEGAKTITVTAGKRTSRIDFVLEAAPTGGVSGHLTIPRWNFNPDHGFGMPFPGVQVRAYNADGTFVSTTTDASGRYSLSGVRVGDCTLQFIAPARFQNMGTRWYGDSPDQVSSRPVTVKYGEITTGIDQSLYRIDANRPFAVSGGEPYFVGEMKVGSRLSVAYRGPWVPTPTEYEYSWFRGDEQLTGPSTDPGYTLTAADAGARLTLYYEVVAPGTLWAEIVATPTIMP